VSDNGTIPTPSEALALACELKDRADRLAPLARIPSARKIVARLRALAVDMEKLADANTIPWEETKRKAGL
jgi:hypothetical protein